MNFRKLKYWIFAVETVSGKKSDPVYLVTHFQKILKLLKIALPSLFFKLSFYQSFRSGFLSSLLCEYVRNNPRFTFRNGLFSLEDVLFKVFKSCYFILGINQGLLELTFIIICSLICCWTLTSTRNMIFTLKMKYIGLRNNAKR